MRTMKDSGVAWIGEIPEGWDVRRLKSSLTLKDIKETYSGQEYIGLENVEAHTGKLIKTDISPSGMCNIFAKGDVLFAKLRPYLSKCFVANFDGVCSTEFLVLNTKYKSNNFFKYVIISPHIIDKINSETYGAKMPRANWDVIGNIKIPTPPLPEQRRIADYLDTKCAEIDRSMELVRQGIDKLKEYKKSVITEAVTKGLDPDVPMEDSGVPWIGEIPEGWDIQKIKFFSSIKNGDALRSEDLLDDGPFEAFGGNGKIGNCNKFNCEGNIFIIGRVGALCGNIRRANKKIFVTDNALILKIFRNNFDFIYFSLIAANLGSLSASNAQPLITATKINNVYTPLPSITEQQRIASYLDAKCAEIDTLIAQKQTLLDKLAEYKKSLIFECVTGKREVAA